jgi:predicted O-linked N-acetylglucosamine transferase (SPINDLY family)
MRPKFKNTLKVKPVYSAFTLKVQARVNEAIALHQQGRLAQAQEMYEEILKAEPEQFDALHMLGVIAYQTSRYAVAGELIAKAIALNPSNPASYYNRGLALKELGQLEAAVASYDKAISLKPDYAAAYSARGVALQGENQLESARANFDTAIRLKPDYAEAFNNRGVLLLKQKFLTAAMDSFEFAIRLQPNNPEIHINCGNASMEMRRFSAALISYEKSINLKPDHAEGHSARGDALRELRQLESAMASYDTAIRLKPDFAAAFNNRGVTLKALGQLEAAAVSFGKAIGIDPACDYLLGTLMFTRMQLCDWRDFEMNVAELIHKIQNNAKAIVSFSVLALSDSLSIKRKVAEIYSQDKYPAAIKPMWSGQRYEHKKIRVAYISCDFKVHPATLNNIGMWEGHDRQRFEVIAISYGSVQEGQIRKRLRKAFDRFLDVGDRSDEQIASLMRDMEIDIAVDISGTMQGGRQGILAHKPAPVQVNLYGYTSGAPYIDYILADKVTIPPEHEAGYTEKVVCLPDTWFSSDTSRVVSERQFKRSELELPEQGVVYCSFNNAYKFNPQMFDVWMRILQRVPGSVLWLQGGGQEKVKENLSQEARARGVDPTRLVFAHKIDSMADHLARHRAADVFLDTLPFNAQTTAVDALWAGLPVLTCLGECGFGRMAGSVLMALGMEELVTKGWQEYEAQAVRIGLESGYAKSLKDKLERNRKESPLFDTARLTRNMESAYEQMHQRVQQGLGPQGFEVK